jgi:hypothetical protein
VAVNDEKLRERLTPAEAWYTNAMVKAIDKNASKKAGAV